MVKSNIFGSDRSSEDDDSRFLELDYSIGGGVSMKRTDIDKGFKDQSGKGPKDWQRPDDQIYEEVCVKLTDHSDLDASDVTVNVKNGTVSLSGWVNSRNDKRIAERVSEEVFGVRDVRNEIHLRNRLIKSV